MGPSSQPLSADGPQNNRQEGKFLPQIQCNLQPAPYSNLVDRSEKRPHSAEQAYPLGNAGGFYSTSVKILETGYELETGPKKMAT